METGPDQLNEGLLGPRHTTESYDRYPLVQPTTDSDTAPATTRAAHATCPLNLFTDRRQGTNDHYTAKLPSPWSARKGHSCWNQTGANLGWHLCTKQRWAKLSCHNGMKLTVALALTFFKPQQVEPWRTVECALCARCTDHPTSRRAAVALQKYAA